MLPSLKSLISSSVIHLVSQFSVWLISFAQYTDYLYVHTRTAAQQEFVDEASILVSLEPGLAALRQVLVVLESKLSASGPYCLGSYFTAADAFLYPPMADLMAHPERAIVDEFDKVKKWCAFFGRHELAIKTREGTFEGGFRL